MRKILLSTFALLSSAALHAQTVSTFEALSLSKPTDTSYINFSMPGTDVGFTDGLVYFPSVFDSSGGYYFWSSGFSYSNWTDSVSSGFSNQYAAKTGAGYAASSKYAVAYGQKNYINLVAAAKGKSVEGFYITNSTYAYNSMRDGDAFAKKFNATDKDSFCIDIYGYLAGVKQPDSVRFYLADFRHTDTTKNYIVKDWQWVNLSSLGKVDSIRFVLSSSDNGAFGMNTPAYFCMDNFITNETGVGIAEHHMQADIKFYPNPVQQVLFVEANLNNVQQVEVINSLGQSVMKIEKAEKIATIDIHNLQSGVYFIRIVENGKHALGRFIKQ